MLKTFTLSNGVTVATYNLPQLRSISVSTIVKGGSLVEQKSKNGVAHFMEHMLVQGIPSYPTAEELSTFIESLSGTYNAATSLTSVDFSITVPASHIEDAIKISSEVFFEPLFVSDSLEKERRAVLDEITQRKDSTGYRINQFFKQTRYTKNCPLLLDTGGSLETVKKLNRDDLIEYWQNYFVPKNTYLLVSGKFETEHLQKLLEQYFQKYSSTKTFKGFPDMTPDYFSNAQCALRGDKTLEATYIDISFPSISLDSDLRLRLQQMLCLVILGRVRNSRLFKLLRYQKGLVYSVSSSSSVLPNIGHAYISCECLPAHLDEVIQLIAKELSTFVQNGPTQDELNFVKNFLSNQWLMSFDHPSAISGWIENDLLWRDQILLPEQYIEIIKDVTPSDLIALMQKYWKFDKLNLSVQGAIKNTPAKSRQLMNYFKELKL